MSFKAIREKKILAKIVKTYSANTCTTLKFTLIFRCLNPCSVEPGFFPFFENTDSDQLASDEAI